MSRRPNTGDNRSGLSGFNRANLSASAVKRLLNAAIFYLLIPMYLSAQGEIDNQPTIFLRNEITGGIFLSTDGFGFGYREGKRVDYFNKRLLEIDLLTVKHPKEVKLTNPYYQTPGSFVFGKKNFVAILRGGYGHQKEIFEKADLGGVAVRYFYTGGAAVAFYKPIYYKMLKFVGPYEAEIIEEKFDIKKHDPTMIYSKSSFFKGLNEARLLPGLYGKAGFNFEYSRQDKVIHAIEIGAQINMFPKALPIMDTARNKAIFFSLFASYRFGLIIDPLNPESNKLSNIFRRNL
ncbi:MAG TPA: hypothetical protein PL040_03250 [Bacteroidales bacterium]|nr:hypothetical protein [Bacteroidales bacterium]